MISEKVHLVCIMSLLYYITQAYKQTHTYEWQSPNPNLLVAAATDSQKNNSRNMYMQLRLLRTIWPQRLPINWCVHAWNGFDDSHAASTFSTLLICCDHPSGWNYQIYLCTHTRFVQMHLKKSFVKWQFISTTHKVAILAPKVGTVIAYYNKQYIRVKL